MAYINVDEVYILDNTGAQVDAVTDIPFKADAGLTAAQKAQARANLGISEGGGGGGRNLLDNPWFTINQRDVAVGVIVNSSNYIADRWVAPGSAGAQRNADGTITNNATIYQKLSATIPVGKSVTFSVLLGDGTMETWTDVFDGSSTKTMDLPSFGTSRFYMGSTPPQINIGACAKTIVAVKLELGTTSTLAQDAPPNYAEELDKCLLYCEVVDNTSTSNRITIGAGDSVSSGSIYMAIKLHPKRKISFASLPNPVVTGSVGYGEHSPSETATSVNWFAFDPNSGFGTLQIQGSNIAANTRYRVLLNQSSKIVFSADL